MANKNKKDINTTVVRIVSLGLAIVMVLSVVLATVWRW